MRFAIAHKAASYLMVGFALLAVIGDGALSPVASYGGLLAFAISWWWEPPRLRGTRTHWLWTVLTLVMFAYSVLTGLATLDVLLVGGQFLVWLTIVKAFNRRTARDWQQMYLLAFLMLVAGSVLNPSLTYGACFFGFVIATTWAVTLFHLRREMEDNLLVKHAVDRASERVEVRRILDSRRIVGGRFFVGTGLLSLGVFVGAAIVFLALPRVGVGFLVKSRGGVTLAGFSDGVKLGGHGVIKQDATVVMRVEIDARYGGRDAPPIHWRGVAFEHYSTGQWSRTPEAMKTSRILEERMVDDRRFLMHTGPRPAPGAVDVMINDVLVKQDVWLEPIDTATLFGASMPRVFVTPLALRRHERVSNHDALAVEHNSTVHYTVYSDLDVVPDHILRKAGGELPSGFRQYLQLPPEITARTRALARNITHDAPTQYDKVVAIQRWLADNLSYTLELEEPGDREPVDFFLFERKRGHCEYFASAFSVLARAVGIPVRQVNGFLGGEWNEYQNYVAVRAGDAHSWNEVFYPGLGGSGIWVTVDATPPGDIDELGRGATGWRAKLARFLDTVRFQWNKWVIEYDLGAQLSVFKSIGSGLKSIGSAIKGAALRVKETAVAHWPWFVSAAIALGTLIGLRLRRRRAARPTVARVIRRKSSAIAGLYEVAARRVAKAGFVRSASDTPRELAARAVAANTPWADALSELTELYYSAQWGGHSDREAMRRATELSKTIAETLRASGRPSAQA